MLTIDDKWKFTEQALSALQKKYDNVSVVSRALKLCPESPLVDPVYAVGNELIKALSVLVGDKYEHIDWYVNECDFGRNEEMWAGCEGNMQLIDNCEKLRWLIELNCEN